MGAQEMLRRILMTTREIAEQLVYPSFLEKNQTDSL